MWEFSVVQNAVSKLGGGGGGCNPKKPKKNPKKTSPKFEICGSVWFFFGIFRFFVVLFRFFSV